MLSAAGLTVVTVPCEGVGPGSPVSRHRPAAARRPGHTSRDVRGLRASRLGRVLQRLPAKTEPVPRLTSWYTRCSPASFSPCPILVTSGCSDPWHLDNIKDKHLKQDGDGITHIDQKSLVYGDENTLPQVWSWVSINSFSWPKSVLMRIVEKMFSSWSLNVQTFNNSISNLVIMAQGYFIVPGNQDKNVILLHKKCDSQ